MQPIIKDKPFYMSKTVWAGIIIAAYGIVNNFYDISAFQEVIISLATGLGIVGIRGAIAKK